jgi:hypothetical protein
MWREPAQEIIADAEAARLMREWMDSAMSKPVVGWARPEHVPPVPHGRFDEMR